MNQSKINHNQTIEKIRTDCRINFIVACQPDNLAQQKNK